jgi:hypothetical protein
MTSLPRRFSAEPRVPEIDDFAPAADLSPDR